MDSVITAIALGALFGFVLQRIGAGDPDKIINMLRLKDFHLMKAILAGIGISSLLFFFSLNLGLIELAHVKIKTMYLGVPIGGVLLGIGWALSGYCPGTGVVAAGSGRKDGLFFIAGGLVGAAIFAGIYELIKEGVLFEKLFGGKVTLAETGASTALFTGGQGFSIALILGLLMIIIAKTLPTLGE